MASPADIERLFHNRRRMLWALCYRLTGVAADADEIVQETFVRALEHAPSAGDDERQRWLVRVATNLGLDHLRARKRRSYVGSWLPSPVETIETSAGSVEAQYERREAVSYAFLIALERLQPKSRAVLILREVFDYPADEVADLLGTSEANVRVLHHRARRNLGGMPLVEPAGDLAAATRSALERFLDCMLRQDARGIEALLTESVRTITDAGGEYTALHAPLVGASRVARFHLETARRRGPVSRVEIRMVNGVPALLIETRPLRPKMAPRVVLRCEIDGDGRIRELHSILAPRKLTAVRFATAQER